MTPYQQLEARFARRGALQEALAVLGWDHSAMMPAGGAKARADQVSTLEVMAHEILTLAYGTHLIGRLLNGRGAIARLRTAIERLVADARAPRN